MTKVYLVHGCYIYFLAFFLRIYPKININFGNIPSLYISGKVAQLVRALVS